jgi:hypothetical protein
MTRDQDLPAVVSAAVVVEGALHVICGNGAHHVWDAKTGGWIECAPVPESFVGRKKMREALEVTRRQKEREYDAAMEAKRHAERQKPLQVVLCEIITKKGNEGASITHIYHSFADWAQSNHAHPLGRASLEKGIEALLAAGLIEKRMGPRDRPVFAMVRVV